MGQLERKPPARKEDYEKVADHLEAAFRLIMERDFANFGLSDGAFKASFVALGVIQRISRMRGQGHG